MNAFYFLVLFIWLMSCADNKSSKPNPSGSPTPSGSPAIGSTEEVCKELAKNSVATSADYNQFVIDLCSSGGLQKLRASQYRGVGNVSDPVNTSAATGSSSNLKVSASFATDKASAKSYFAMMKLQIDQPSVFDDTFEFDKLVTYTRLSGNGTSTQYRYLNTKEDITVEYNAESTFVEASAGKLYLVTSKQTPPAISVVQSFRGIQIIFQYGTTTEVFSLADQTFDNQNNHESMVRKALNSFRDELGRSYRNSLKAGNL